MHRFYGISEKLEGLVYAECQDEQRRCRKTLKRKKIKFLGLLPLLSRLSPAEKEQSLKSSQQVSSFPTFFALPLYKSWLVFADGRGGKGKKRKEEG